MMGKTKVKMFLFSFLLAAVAACLSVALVACSGGGDDGKSAGKYGVGEEGIYYYDKDSSTEYLMTLQSGVYMISMDGASGYSGTYSYDDETKSVSFKTSDGDAFEASFSDDVMQLEIAGTPYTFLKKVDYAVKFMDGSTTVGTQSVTYGKNASKIDAEKDGYIFLGWYEDAAFTTQYKFNTSVTADTTLYAYYIPVDSTIANFEVQFVSGGDVIYTTTTQNGVVYDFPEEEVAGWWVSATNNEDELTYEYKGEILTESTKLFAVKSYTLGASVYGDGLKWNAAVASATITVDGEVVSSAATGTSFAYDFDSLSAGRHEMTIAASGTTENLVYMTKALSRVSNFSVYGTTLVYNAVENAQYYYVSVTCGNPSHDHEMVYNGNTLTYDFSNCVMGPEGISFTVYACAQGYVESVSETYVYALILDGTTVTIDKTTDTASWTAVSGASGYEVYINSEYAVTTTDTEYSLKYYDMGDEIAVSVKPVAPGYWSEESAAAEYTKATLKAPEITGINEYTVSWTEIEEATNYIIYVNGKQIETVENDIFSYALANDADFVHADSYVITIKAVNADNVDQNSQESDAVYATDDTMSELLVYEDGTVYWQYAMAAGTYYVTVNDENETAVEGRNFFDVTFTQSGENVIKVWFTTESGDSALAQLSVTAYAVIFNSEGGTAVDTVYVAKGDTLKLDTPTYSYGTGENTFLGWYTLPNPDGLTATDYLGDGVRVENGSVFSGNSTLILYACWEILKSNTRLVVGAYGDVEGETELYYEIPVNTASYELPVPDGNDAAYMFYGWFSEPDGRGTQYTYYDGTARAEYSNTNVSTIYAYWIEVLAFSATTYENVDYAEVYAGADINLVPAGEVTVPETYAIGGTVYTVGVINSGAFAGCSGLVALNIPDTIVYISTVNDGYTAGTGAFASSASIKAVNVYATGEEDTAREITYYSADGVLYAKNSDGGVTLTYYPRGKTDASFVIPEYVSNDNEYEVDGTGTKKVYRAVTTIANRVLYSNPSVTNVVIPATVTLVDIQAFQASALGEVTFADTVTNAVGVSAATSISIASKAFQNCASLVSVTFPSRLTSSSFESDTFTGCTKFAKLSIAAGGECGVCEDILYNANLNAVIYCPYGRTEDIVWSGAVTRIEENAFASCTGLTSVYIPAGISYIGVSAFNGCTGIMALTFEDRANANPLTIAEKAFYGCTALTAVSLPVGVETIGAQAFAGCTRLSYVYIDCAEGTTADQLDFAEGAFGTSVTTLEFGEFVPMIHNFVQIFGSSNLNTVTINPNNKNYTEDSCGFIYDSEGKSLIWASNYAGEYTTLDTCVTIEAEAFEGRWGITKVTITNKVQEIGAYAFYGCSGLKSIVFEAGSVLETIGDFAFAGSGITTITIPASVKYMGEYDSQGELVSISVFENCSALGEIIVEEGNQYFATADGILYTAEDGTPTQLVVCPVYNKVTDIVIPSSVTKIWGNAFYNNSSIRSVAFENGEVDGEIEFGENVFYNCKSLEKVELPTGLKTLPSKLFYECSSLTEVTIPYTVTSIESRVFGYCYGLETVTFADLPEEVSLDEYPLTIGDTESTSSTYGPFYYCSSLTEIALPDRTTAISQGAFYYCTGLRTVTIGANLTSISEWAFGYCYKLSEVRFGNDTSCEVKLSTIETWAFYEAGKESGDFGLTLPTSMRTLEQRAFANCYITYLDLNEGLTTIGIGLFGIDNASNNKATVKTLEIPSTVTSLGSSSTFQYTKSLETVSFAAGSNLTEIPKTAFQYCTGLKSISLPEGVGTIGEQAFSGCIALETVSFPSTITSIGASAFDGCLKLTGVTFETEKDGSNGEYGLSQMKTFGNYTFQNCTALETFTFPETSSSITLGNYMFMGCVNLTTLVFSSGITDIGSGLGGCYGIKTIDTTNCTAFGADETGLPILYTKENGVISGSLVFVFGDVTGKFTLPETVTTIGASAFVNQVTLTEIAIPTTVTSIGNYAFDGCINLTSVAFYDVETTGAKNISVGNAAFRQTKISGIDFTGFDSVTLGSMVFAYCYEMTEATLNADTTFAAGTGDTVSNQGTFAYCTSLKTVILGDATEIPAYTFYGCTSLVSVAAAEENLEDGRFDLSTLTSIGAAAFEGTAATNVILSSGTPTTIGAGTSGTTGAFAACTSLTYAVLGATTSVPAYTFYGCTKLTKVASAEKDLTDGTFALSSVTGIGAAAFEGTAASKVVLSEENVTVDAGNAANTGAFSAMTSLETVILGGLSTIPAYTFYGCTKLAAVGATGDDLTVGGTSAINLSGITATADYIFYNCSSATLVIHNLGEGVGAAAYYGCSKLTTVGTYSAGAVTYTEGVANLEGVTVGKAAFASSGLVDVVLSSTTSLAEGTGTGTTNLGAFGSCSSLETVDLGGLANITAYTFYGCSKLATVTGSGSLSSLGNYAFYGCTKLYTIGDVTGTVDISGVAAPGTYMFYNCTTMERAILNPSTQINSYMFYGASSLVAIASNESGLFVDGNPVANLSGMSFVSTSTSVQYEFAKTGIETLILGSLDTIRLGAFEECSSLTTIAKNANSIEYGTADLSGVSVGKTAFYKTGIEKVVFDSVTTLGDGSGTGTSSGAFSDCTALTEIEFGGITAVGAYTFYNCTGLTEIVLGSCAAIGKAAFCNCTSLETVALSEETEVAGTFDVSGISLGTGAFANTAVKKLIVSSLTEITAGTGTSSASASAFANCTQLETVVYGKDTLVAYSFYGCTNLRSLAATESALVDGTVDLTGINMTAMYLFYQCENIEKLILGTGGSINNCSFAGCTSLVTVGDTDGVAEFGNLEFARGAFTGSGLKEIVFTDTVSMTGGITVSGDSGGTFSACDDLISVDLGGQTEIADCSFGDCVSLETVTGAYNLSDLGDSAFYGCTSLKSFAPTEEDFEDGVVDLSGTTYMEADAFSFCDLITAYKAEDNDVYYAVDGILYSYAGEMVAVPCGLTENVTIADGTTSVNSYAFRSNTSIEKVTVPESVTSIGSYAFYECTGLKKVTILGECVKIGNYAFSGATALEELTAEEGIGTIGNYAFQDCAELKYVNIVEGSEEIGNYAFTGCSALEGVEIPYTVLTIGYGAFNKCTSLSYVTFRDVPEEYGDDEYPLTILSYSGNTSGVFYNCTSLKEIVLPTRLSAISVNTSGSTSSQYGYVFSGSGLETVTINGTGFTSSTFGYYVFATCTSLETVYIGEGVEYIGRYAFYNCTALENVYIPDDVTQIDQYAFRGCTALKSLVIPESVSTLGSSLFYGLTSECTIYFSVDYRTATLNWLTYTADTTSESTSEAWKSNSDANYAFYMEIPDDTSELVDIGVTYWYYDASGNIVEWTVAGLPE